MKTSEYAIEIGYIFYQFYFILEDILKVTLIKKYPVIVGFSVLGLVMGGILLWISCKVFLFLEAKFF